MRLASATYAPLSIEEGDVFTAYCFYFESLRHGLAPWLEQTNGEALLNSILAIGRHEYQALSRRIEETHPECDYRLVGIGEGEALRVAEEVPCCRLCGKLLERDGDGDWFCGECQLKQSPFG